ncbi:hypothetical protein NDU88_008781 [Pleurodeles waltl]|uniref:Uncharacterized protein n=1 Tax=Pleurodeles waltl TaxID=8319 RepID=A0AAV7QTS4_PLEWA|nr:hypothetical protein NDU88_008780 [Pleurodeles waltl]KAJ1142460.1 hypothetical protein NDU88_008781 [Pleurodeles waltl]
MDALIRPTEEEGEHESPEGAESRLPMRELSNTAKAIEDSADMDGVFEIWSEEWWTPPEDAEEAPQIRRVAA